MKNTPNKISFGSGNTPTITLTELRKTYKGEFKPTFGRGTGAGDIKCPICHRLLGTLITVDSTLNANAIDKVKVFGSITIRHSNDQYYDWQEWKTCQNANKLVDYSTLTIADLHRNTIPQEYFDHRNEWDALLEKDAQLAGTTIQKGPHYYD